jgi:putative transcriptional regulator
MSKAGERMIASARQALAYAKDGERQGFVAHVPEHVDVKAIREAEGLTQDAFAERYGFTTSSVREWEQGRRQPERSARLLLKLIEQAPDVVRRVLSAA